MTGGGCETVASPGRVVGGRLAQAVSSATDSSKIDKRSNLMTYL
jgi:hypothetical protein